VEGLAESCIAFLTHPRSPNARKVARDPRVAFAIIDRAIIDRAITNRAQPNVMAQVAAGQRAVKGPPPGQSSIRCQTNTLAGPMRCSNGWWSFHGQSMVFPVEPKHARAQAIG
jgi:hypothetical protein